MKQKISGIYEIRHRANGRSYVGSSVDVKRRWVDHLYRLSKCNHHSKHLQRAWDKHGPEAFEFLIIELLADAKALPERETHYIVARRAEGGVYNVALVGGSTRGLVRGPMADDIRARIAATHRGMKASAETRAKLSDVAKRRPPVSDETRAKHAARMTGRKLPPLSEGHRALISAVHRGKTISEAHRQALSRAHKGRKLSEEHRRKKSEAAKRQHARQRAERETRKLAEASQA